MTSLQQLVAALVGLANSIIPLMLAIAVIVFIWGIINFLWHPDKPDLRSQMKTFMIMGVISIAVILSIWSLASLLKNTLFPSAPCPIGIPGCGGTSSTALPTYSSGPTQSGTPLN